MVAEPCSEKGQCHGCSRNLVCFGHRISEKARLKKCVRGITECKQVPNGCKTMQSHKCLGNEVVGENWCERMQLFKWVSNEVTRENPKNHHKT